MFSTHRIFCAAPSEMEAEWRRFYDTIGSFNESCAMPRGVLYVPVALTNVRDKRPLQSVIDENIRDCRHFLLLLLEGWGPPDRNFRTDYHLALQCAADPALPMHSVAVLAKKQPSGAPLAEGLPEPADTFSTLEEFDACLNSLLAQWLESLAPEKAPASVGGQS